ncbi:hypothetical protein BB560_000530 [Smittium megazygosporum]|uniref:Uncharacterized protein n=1 Tax=Smittium megazygosporum TaxID=133381 RepID=A0A2T9ZK36_9FUNG|nr:hypothetical protein BB560_000530 [Smittium megazygosporum]
MNDYTNLSSSIERTSKYLIPSLPTSPRNSSILDPKQNIDDSEEIFSLEPVEFNSPSKFLALSVENDTVHIPLPSDHADSVCSIYTDPNAFHSIIAYSNGLNFYYHNTWDTAILLAPLKDKIISSVGWFKPIFTETPEPNSASALLGLDNGKIIHVELNSNDKPGKKTLKLATEVFQLDDHESIQSLEIESFPGRSLDTNTIIFLTTKNKFYQFIQDQDYPFSNNPSIQAPFTTFFKIHNKRFYFLEIGDENSQGKLSLYRKFHEFGAGSTPNSFAWLTENGVYFGSLSYGSQQAGDSLIETANIIPYDFDQNEAASNLILTEFHIILLTGKRVQVISRLNSEVVFEKTIESENCALQLAVDSINRTYWVLTPTELIEIVVQDETRDLWKIFLQQKKFESSIKYCKSDQQKSIVYRAQADHYFDTKRFLLSATYYAKSNAKVEEVAIKYLNQRDITSLKTFLYNKLLSLSKKITLLATWLVQVFLVMLGLLDKTILTGTTAQGEMDPSAASAKEERDLLVEEFHLFLDTFNIYLHPKTVLNFIGSYARNDSLVHYLYLLKDYPAIIEHYLFEKNYKKSLKVLNKNGSPEDFYRHKNLDPEKLIPAFIEYESVNVSEEANYSKTSSSLNQKSEGSQADSNQALRYLEFAVYQLMSQSKVLHNYFFSLLVKQNTKSEAKILEFLEFFSENPVCNLEYALSLCLKYNRVFSATFIYSLLDCHEDSVALALKIGDVELAIQQINKLNESRDFGQDIIGETITESRNIEMEKRLWLQVLKYLIQEKNDLARAIEILKKTNLITVQDLLVYYPNFDSIGDLKDVLCETLDDYEQQVNNLHMDMQESMKNASLISDEIRNINSRYAIIAENEQCQICFQPALIKEIYVFPCQHVFHCDCLTRKVLVSSIRINAKKIRLLQAKIADISKKRRELKLANIGGLFSGIQKKSKAQPKDSLTKVDELVKDLVNLELKSRKELDDIVARECVLCGEPNIKSIAIPFIDDEKDSDLVASWSL